MPVTVRRFSEMTLAFRLGADDIERLSGILSPIGDRSSYSITCSDGLTRKYDRVKDVLSYENPPAKQIRDFTIDIGSKSYDASAELEFRNNRYTSIRVRLDGPEEIISKISNDLDDFFPRITTWYRFIATDKFTYISAWLISTFLFLWLYESRKGTSTTAETAFMLMSVPGCMFALGFIFNRFQNWIFPMAEFAIGQGFQRDAHRERLRRSVIGIIVVPSILSGLGLLIWKIVG